MNKYQSGYAAISLITAIGWVTVALSVAGGIAIAMGADRNGEIGLLIGAAGAIQGFILVGIGSVGQAILDGSLALQEMSGKRDDTTNVGNAVNVVPSTINAVVPSTIDASVYEIYDLSKRAWALFAIAENKQKSGDFDGAAAAASESMKVAKSIEDVNERDAVVKRLLKAIKNL